MFVGGADGFAPGIGAEGVDVFVLGEVQSLDEGLAEIGEGTGRFRFHLALGDSGEEASEGGAEIAGGHVAAGKVIGDFLAGFVASEGLRFLTGVEGAEVRMASAPGNAATAAVCKRERTQRGTVVLMGDRRAANGAIGHGSLQKERLDLGFLGSLAEARRTTERREYITGSVTSQ